MAKAADEDWIEFEIANWSKFNPRPDRKKHSWFRLDHGIAGEKKLSGLTPAQCWAAVVIMAEYSKSGGRRLRVRKRHLAHQARVSLRDINVVLDQLFSEKFLLTPEDADALRTGNQSDTDWPPGGPPPDADWGPPGDLVPPPGVQAGDTVRTLRDGRNERDARTKDPGTENKNAGAHTRETGTGGSPPQPPAPGALDPESLQHCAAAWRGTLQHFDAGRDLLARELTLIQRALNRWPPKAVEMAIVGRRFEPASPRYDPAKNLAVGYVLPVDDLSEDGERKFQRLLTLGAQAMQRAGFTSLEEYRANSGKPRQESAKAGDAQAAPPTPLHRKEAADVQYELIKALTHSQPGETPSNLSPLARRVLERMDGWDGLVRTWLLEDLRAYALIVDYAEALLEADEHAQAPPAQVRAEARASLSSLLDLKSPT